MPSILHDRETIEVSAELLAPRGVRIGHVTHLTANGELTLAQNADLGSASVRGHPVLDAETRATVRSLTLRDTLFGWTEEGRIDAQEAHADLLGAAHLRLVANAAAGGAALLDAANGALTIDAAGNLGTDGYVRFGTLEVPGALLVDRDRNLQNVRSAAVQETLSVAGQLGVGLPRGNAPVHSVHVGRGDAWLERGALRMGGDVVLSGESGAYRRLRGIADAHVRTRLLVGTSGSADETEAPATETLEVRNGGILVRGGFLRLEDAAQGSYQLEVREGRFRAAGTQGETLLTLDAEGKTGVGVLDPRAQLAVRASGPVRRLVAVGAAAHPSAATSAEVRAVLDGSDGARVAFDDPGYTGPDGTYLGAVQTRLANGRAVRGCWLQMETAAAASPGRLELRIRAADLGRAVRHIEVLGSVTGQDGTWEALAEDREVDAVDRDAVLQWAPRFRVDRHRFFRLVIRAVASGNAGSPVLSAARWFDQPPADPERPALAVEGPATFRRGDVHVRAGERQEDLVGLEATWTLAPLPARAAAAFSDGRRVYLIPEEAGGDLHWFDPRLPEPLRPGAAAQASSSLYGLREAGYAFDRDASTWWASAPLRYDAQTGEYAGAEETLDRGGTVYRGEWIQLELSAAARPALYRVEPVAAAAAFTGPRQYWLLGSPTAAPGSFVLLDARSFPADTTVPQARVHALQLPSDLTDCRFFRLVVGAVGATGPQVPLGSRDAAQVARLDLFGDREGAASEPTLLPMALPQLPRGATGGFASGLVHGDHGYLIPRGHGRLVRFRADSVSDPEVLDLADMAAGFLRGWVHDGDLYLLPVGAVRWLVRVDLAAFAPRAPVDLGADWPGAVDGTLFEGHLYLALAPPRSAVARLQLPLEPGSVVVPDPTPLADGTSCTALCGIRGELYGVLDRPRQVVRIDVASRWGSAEAAVSVLDLVGRPELRGFHAIVEDGRFAYLLPDGSHGHVVRFDPIARDGRVETLDLEAFVPFDATGTPMARGRGAVAFDDHLFVLSSVANGLVAVRAQLPPVTVAPQPPPQGTITMAADKLLVGSGHADAHVEVRGALEVASDGTRDRAGLSVLLGERAAAHGAPLLQLRSCQTEHVFEASGRVGIRTAQPEHALDVRGRVAAEGWILRMGHERAYRFFETATVDVSGRYAMGMRFRWTPSGPEEGVLQDQQAFRVVARCTLIGGTLAHAFRRVELLVSPIGPGELALLDAASYVRGPFGGLRHMTRRADATAVDIVWEFESGLLDSPNYRVSIDYELVLPEDLGPVEASLLQQDLPETSVRNVREEVRAGFRGLFAMQTVEPAYSGPILQTFDPVTETTASLLTPLAIANAAESGAVRVQRWFDQSGAMRHAEQLDPARMPLLRRHPALGTPEIYFPDAQSTLELPETAPEGLAAPGFTIQTVHSTLGGTGAYYTAAAVAFHQVAGRFFEEVPTFLAALEDGRERAVHMAEALQGPVVSAAWSAADGGLIGRINLHRTQSFAAASPGSLEGAAALRGEGGGIQGLALVAGGVAVPLEEQRKIDEALRSAAGAPEPPLTPVRVVRSVDSFGELAFPDTVYHLRSTPYLYPRGPTEASGDWAYLEWDANEEALVSGPHDGAGTEVRLIRPGANAAYDALYFSTVDPADGPWVLLEHVGSGAVLRYRPRGLFLGPTETETDDDPRQSLFRLGDLASPFFKRAENAYVLAKDLYPDVLQRALLLEPRFHGEGAWTDLSADARASARALYSLRRRVPTYEGPLIRVREETLSGVQILGFAQGAGDGVAWNALAASPALLYVAVGAMGAVATSPDGLRWTRQPDPVAGGPILRTVAWCADRFVLAGDEAVLASSVDGVQWTRATLPSEVTGLRTVVHVPGSGVTLAVGSGTAGAVVLSSEDRATWSVVHRPIGTAGAYVAAAVGGDRVVVVGDGADHVLVSTDGRTWRTVPLPQALSLRAVAWIPSRERFVAAGLGSGVWVAEDREAAEWTHAGSAAALADGVRQLLHDPDLDRLFAVTDADGLWHGGPDGVSGWTPISSSITALLGPLGGPRRLVASGGAVALGLLQLETSAQEYDVHEDGAVDQAAGAAVVRWYDQSGAGRDATLTPGARAPRVVPHGAVYFGPACRLELPDGTVPWQGAPFTVCARHAPRLGATDDASLVRAQSADGLDRVALGRALRSARPGHAVQRSRAEDDLFAGRTEVFAEDASVTWLYDARDETLFLQSIECARQMLASWVADRLPPAPLTADETHLPGTGRHAVSVSYTRDPTLQPGHRIFDRSTEGSWSCMGRYHPDTGAYLGSELTPVVEGSDYAGEWAQLELPYRAALTSYRLHPIAHPFPQGLRDRMPRSWVVLGSNDGELWERIDERQDVEWGRRATFLPALEVTVPYTRTDDVGVYEDAEGGTHVVVPFYVFQEQMFLESERTVRLEGSVQPASHAPVDGDLAPIWYQVIHAPEINSYVAVGGYTFLVAISTNGVDWMRHQGPTTLDVPATEQFFTSVAWSPQHVQLVAVGRNMIATSVTFGVSWESQPLPEPNVTLHRVVWSAELLLYVAAGSRPDLSGVLWTSVDGRTWTAATTAAPLPGEPIDVAWSPEMGAFVAILYERSSAMRSTDGVHWDVVPLPAPASCLTWSPQRGTFLALGDRVAMLSTTGAQWELAAAATAFEAGPSVCWSPDRAEFVGIDRVGHFHRSADGRTWVAHPLFDDTVYPLYQSAVPVPDSTALVIAGLSYLDTLPSLSRLELLETSIAPVFRYGTHEYELRHAASVGSTAMDLAFYRNGVPVPELQGALLRFDLSEPQTMALRLAEVQVRLFDGPLPVFTLAPERQQSWYRFLRLVVGEVGSQSPQNTDELGGTEIGEWEIHGRRAIFGRYVPEEGQSIGNGAVAIRTLCVFGQALSDGDRIRVDRMM